MKAPTRIQNIESIGMIKNVLSVESSNLTIHHKHITYTSIQTLCE